jgi:5-methylcytosine-specific restriction endonuclease McrA
MRVLLLNSTYEPIFFISMRKAIKLYVKEKVEVLSCWNESIKWCSGNMKLPAVVRLKYFVRWIPRTVRFNRVGVFRRDKFECKYCGAKKIPLTIDHIIPRSKGGENNYLNTITSCVPCNSKKDDRTPEQAGMQLLSKPFVPRINLSNELLVINDVHEDWKIYLR